MLEKILVIEDDTGAAELACMILDKEGYEVQSAEDGALGVQKAKEMQPAVAIIDLMLPSIHGYEVCERLREDAQLKDLKILICSSKSYTQDIDGALDAGADDYITKPYKVDDLVARVRALLEKKGDAPNGRSAAITPSSPA